MGENFGALVSFITAITATVVAFYTLIEKRRAQKKTETESSAAWISAQAEARRMLTDDLSTVLKECRHECEEIRKELHIERDERQRLEGELNEERANRKQLDMTVKAQAKEISILKGKLREV